METEHLMQPEREARKVPAPSKEPRNRPVRRLSINIPEPSYQSLEKLSQESGRTMTEIVGFGLGLIELVLQEASKGNNLAITDENNEVQTTIWLPLSAQQAHWRANA